MIENHFSQETFTKNSNSKESLSFTRLRCSRRLSHQIIISLSLRQRNVDKREEEKKKENYEIERISDPTFTIRLDFKRVMMIIIVTFYIYVDWFDNELIITSGDLLLNDNNSLSSSIKRL
jgi:hypothetical protein